jgi:glycine/D-amino acid oxidase-like deaminating enzyme
VATPVPGLARSWWLQEALEADPGRPCPPLDEVVRADVCIVGGGYTGLWTALELRRRAPEVSVVLLEGDICGGGASGRNGGFATSWWDELPELEHRFGPEQGRVLAEASTWAIDELEAFHAERRIAGFRRGGAISMATCTAQVGRWRPALDALARAGREQLVQELTGDEVRARTGSPLALAGVLFPGATVQPAFFVRGLRAAALEAGVRIYEHSPMLAIDRARPARVETPRGAVEADSVVLATNAWLARMRDLRRAIVPVASYIVLTEPAPERIARIGWTGGEALGDERLLVHYTHVTHDGRIAFGRGGGAIGAAGRVPWSMEHDRKVVEIVARDFRRFFPELRDLRLTHAWGGPIDRAPGHLPFAGHLDGAEHIRYFAGYSGNGVAPSRIGGRVLASLTLGTRDELLATGIADGPPGYLPPEPLRTIGGFLVRTAVRRAEAAEERERVPDPISRIGRKLVWATTPRAIEPRLARRSR